MPAYSREAIELGLGVVAAEAFPPRYRVHKYWGRKPANVVARHVAFFTREGELVLDPFAGSGVTLVEAVRLRRRALGFDLNPFAVRLTNAMLTPPDERTFAEASRAVMARVTERVGALYLTRCDGCGRDARVRSVGYENDVPREVRYACAHCGITRARAPDARDLALCEADIPAPAHAPDDDIVFGWEMQKLKRRKVVRWRELFTPRNYATAAWLRDESMHVDDPRSREWLLLTLTAALAQCTRMIADFRGEAGGPSWKINCYWLPARWQELNPLWYFENRVKKSLESIRDLTRESAERRDARAVVQDSRRLPVPDGAVDYVFTDPPYGGEGIQYGELSTLWCLWLGEREELASEIAYNPYRGLDERHYQEGLERVFDECFRVLKPERMLTVTFANKDPEVWDALMNACRAAGFALVTAAPMKRSLPSLTETNMPTAPKADLVLNFVRPKARTTVAIGSSATYSLVEAVTRIADALEREGKVPTASDVFDRVTVNWFSWFYEAGQRPAALRPTLARVAALLAERNASALDAERREDAPCG